MKNTIYIILRNDDPGPLSDPKKERRVLELFEKYSAPQVLAVIPNNVDDPHVHDRGNFHPLEKNPAIIELLREYHQKGLIEIAQHGYTHQTSSFRPSIKNEITSESFYQGINGKWVAYQPAHEEGYSEFNGLSIESQREKVVKGQEYLEKIFNTKLLSFIFPWNAYNRDVLKILKQRGFKYVPCEEDLMVVPGLDLIGACNWDWHIDDFMELLKEMQGHGRPVLTQFGYHSWEVSDEMLGKIEKLLQYLSSNDNIKMILPRDIPQHVPWVRSIIPLRCLMIKLENELNSFLERKIYAPRYYIRNHLYYLKRIIKLLLSLLILKYLGLRKTRLVILAGGLFLLAHSLILRFHLDLMNWFDWALILTVGALALVYRPIRKRVHLDTDDGLPQEDEEEHKALEVNDPDEVPDVGEVQWGDFKRIKPIDPEFGADRGTPIDRYYIEKFLGRNQSDVKGHVLELEDDAYTKKFGQLKITKSDVLNLDPGNPKATFVGDLANGKFLPSNTFDCVILTQALFMVYDVRSAIHTLHRILKPGGVVLVTVPAISPAVPNDGASWKDYWRFTRASARLAFEEFFSKRSIKVSGYGNVFAAVSFLQGIALEEIDKKRLDYSDPAYDVIVSVRAVKNVKI